jgi:hypothetical protein
MGARSWHWGRVPRFPKVPSDATRLGARALNRALLARQGLLARLPRRAPATLERLIGLQAQNTASPYVALWSRLDGFRVEDLSRLLRTRRAVRLALFRSTVPPRDRAHRRPGRPRAHASWTTKGRACWRCSRPRRAAPTCASRADAALVTGLDGSRQAGRSC